MSITIHSLPNELLSQILQQTTSRDASTTGAPPPSTLLSCALVCRRWVDPSQELLHEQVHLTSRRRSEIWLQEGAKWRERVMSLENRWSGQLGREGVRELLGRCTRLERLTIELQPDQLGVLSELQGLKGLNHLHLILHRPFHRPPPPPSPHPLPFSLHSLTLTSNGGLPSSFLTSLITSSLPTLTSLNLNSYTGPRTPSFFLPFLPLCPFLLHLNLGTPNISSASFLRLCSSLLSFSCTTLYVIPALDLPPTLRSLEVKEGMMIEALATAVRTCPALVRVEVREALLSKRREAGSVFVQECRERGIEVRLKGEEEGQFIDGPTWLLHQQRPLPPLPALASPPQPSPLSSSFPPAFALAV
ncbi:hypothetical protein BCR35DRAFT_112106 [Leucosporidium creatinivorum]|uniref:F-box domain-containing protein n=1 Tax=Leucosporidium creatinivorum TaxID=106004 RepID=A0A1Y2F2H6_9BASI|nr:hypothetical protein BCR35DRAFT_112106 [Leucosporidium creatinivorum]